MIERKIKGWEKKELGGEGALVNKPKQEGKPLEKLVLFRGKKSPRIQNTADCHINDESF